MDSATQFQMPTLTVYFSNNANTLGKDMNLSILSPAMGK